MLEKAMTSCCIEWADKSLNVMSFNISVFIFVYIVPMSLIFYFNTVLILMVTLIVLKIWNFFQNKFFSYIYQDQTLDNFIWFIKSRINFYQTHIHTKKYHHKKCDTNRLLRCQLDTIRNCSHVHCVFWFK